MFRSITHPHLHRFFVTVRSVLLWSLVIGAFPALRLFFFFSDVPCPNVTTSYVEIASPVEPEPPIKGSLVLVGGGWIPPSVYDAFLRRAGGPNAILVLIPTAGNSVETEPIAKLIEPWQSRGFARVSVLHTQFRIDANDPSFVQPLKEATAVWMPGGDQKRLINAYRGTLVEAELHRLLERNGVIGGTSAGAAVMSRVMVLPSNDADHLAEGFGFLQNAIVDIHFLKRNRIDRLHEVLLHYPGRFGLGVDEGTAAIIEGENVTMIGDSFVILCQQPSPLKPASTRVLRPNDNASLKLESEGALQRLKETVSAKFGDGVPPRPKRRLNGHNLPPKVEK